MGNLNPDALATWIFGSAVGYLIDGTTGLAWGLAITTGLTVAVGLLFRK